MHHALEIQEILFNVFGHCHLSGLRRCASDLFALARTCRAFKEPALDVLWGELPNSSPLARCLPEATHQISSMREYSFSRPLTQTEWSVLRNYTRRIRAILNFPVGLDWDSTWTFLNLSTTEPLFPNLRQLPCTTDAMHLLHLSLPSLISLDLAFQSKENLQGFQDCLESFEEIAPNVRRLSISVRQSGAAFFSGNISRWRNLQDILCPQISLDADTLVHLSRMSSLVRLTFALSATLPDQIAPFDSPLTFFHLHHLELHSRSLTSVSSLLSLLRLPVISDLFVFIESRPSKQDLPSFFAIIQTSITGRTIQGLELVQTCSSTDDLGHPLGFKDLKPCMAFRNLRRINLDVECDVVLSDSEVLALTMAWPCLKNFVIGHR